MDSAEALQRVYDEFDLNGDGAVSSEEMLALGQARRDLGQKGGKWTAEQNEAMMCKMGVDQHGHVSKGHFVSYFEEELSHVPDDFARTISAFLQCARTLRQRDVGSRWGDQVDAARRLMLEQTKSKQRLEELSTSTPNPRPPIVGRGGRIRPQ